MLIGSSGAFITGTGLGSNIMFAQMHIDAAASLGMNPITIFAGQNAGASLGNLICPNNTVAACATVDAIGRENEVMKHTLRAFAIVLEAVPAKLAALVTKEVGVPTIGIGAGAGCDGQILVYQDMLGMFSDYRPKFVRKFAEVGKVMQEAFASYRSEIQEGNFPTEEHSFAISNEVMAQLEQEAQA